MNKKQKIYFDYNATAPVRPEAVNAFLEVASNPYNASSIHSFGRESKKILSEARNKIQKSFGAEGATIIFNSCGTESNNMALVCLKDIRTIITSEIEHISIAKPASFMNNILLPVDNNGIIKLNNLEDVCKSLKGSKFLVSVIHANNETGVIQPVKEIANIIFENGGYFHIDASQSAGKIDFDFNNLGCDMATISAHKFGGLKGAAALIVKSGLEIRPFLHGGSQEKYLRAGTENIPAIVAMAKASEVAVKNLKEESAKILELRNFIEQGIKDISPEAIIYGNKVDRLPNTLMVSLRGQNSETQMINFDLKNICVSAGAACSSGRVVTSHVLIAMGVDQEDAKCAIRISLGVGNNIEEVKYFLNAWQENYLKQKAKAA
jgi:cysteine desulfurase